MKVKQILMGEREQVQQVALELALMYLPGAVSCLWQEPGQVQEGSSGRGGGASVSQEMLHRPSWLQRCRRSGC